MASSLAKEIGDTSTVDSHRTCSNRRSGENKCSNDKPSTEGRISLEKPIHHGYRQKDEQELLHIWRFWTFNKKL